MVFFKRREESSGVVCNVLGKAVAKYGETMRWGERE